MDNEQHPIDNRRIMYGAQRTGLSIAHRTLSTINILLLRHARKQMVLPATVFVVMTIALGFAYAADRQILRQGADDPQVQMAKDAAAALGRGASPSAIVGSSRQIDMAASLSPFLMVFDDQNRVMQSSGILDGVPPALPSGVFNYVKNHGEDRVIWQPKKGVRIAAVIERVEGRMTGFVLAGRSLEEVEKRERALFWQFFIAWVLGTGVVAGGYFLRNRLRE